jgi:hypothetical protein
MKDSTLSRDSRWVLWPCHNCANVRAMLRTTTLRDKAWCNKWVVFK